MDIANLIPYGKSNAIHLKELVIKTKLKESAIKKAIQNARKNGAAIISGKEGYWRSADQAEKNAFVTRMQQQAACRFDTTKALREQLHINEAQITLDELTDGGNVGDE